MNIIMLPSAVVQKVLTGIPAYSFPQTQYTAKPVHTIPCDKRLHDLAVRSALCLQYNNNLPPWQQETQLNVLKLVQGGKKEAGTYCMHMH